MTDLNDFQASCVSTARYKDNTKFDTVLSDLEALQRTFDSATEAGIDMSEDAKKIDSAMDYLTVLKLQADLTYLFDGLAGEAGEAIEKKKKLYRNQNGMFVSEEIYAENNKFVSKKSIMLELGDVMWYIANIANEIGFELEDVAELLLAKLADREQRNVIKSAGDNR